MAAAAVERIPSEQTFAPVQSVLDGAEVKVAARTPKLPRHDVETTLSYFKANEDGSPPHPTYADRPETYERPSDVHGVTIHDIAGHEVEFSIDK